MTTEADIRFSVEKVGHHYHVIAYDELNRPLLMIEGTASLSMAETKQKCTLVQDCPTCRRQARGVALMNTALAAGPQHFGSRNCRSGSIASGGTRAHCCCDSCY